MSTATVTGWGPVLTAMVTPFDARGALDLDAARDLARWLQAHGNDGLVVAATTGLQAALAGRELAVAAGVLVVSPYYNRPPQAGIEAHFRAVAAVTHLPVMAYDVPVRTGRRMARDTLVRLLREVPNIVAFKDATGDPAAAAALVAEAGAHFDLFSGDDAFTLPLLGSGAVGLVGTTTHWTAALFQDMVASFRAGHTARARAINARLLDSFEFVNSDTSVYPMSIKALLRTQGLAVGECRLPLPPAPPQTEVLAREVLARLQP